jgi:hypothetical protein
MKGGDIQIENPVIYENIDILQTNFKELRYKNRWLNQSSKKCPFCSWNDDSLIVVGFIIRDKTVTEIYQKCFHIIYDINSVELSKKDRNVTNRIRSNFRHIIVNWDNWVTHLNKIGSVF